MTKHPRRALRDPLKGAMPAARQSRFYGILGSDIPRRVVGLLLPHRSRSGVKSLSGLLRVGAVSHRRSSVGAVGRAWA